MLHKLVNLTRQQKGNRAEQLACQYLQQFGLELIDTNYTSKFGEIDLIMRDSRQGNTVFVEVRYRKNNQFGGAAISVTPKKQRRIIKTALHYMQQHAPDAAARFDVIAIEGNIKNANDNDIAKEHTKTAYTINWITDAFQ